MSALSTISPLIRAATADVDALVDVLSEAVTEGARGQSDAATVGSIAVPPTWDEALRQVIPWLDVQVNELRAG